ncbi:hypothetical protein KXV77_009230, partial [Aspergillus fumigatus]
RLLDLRNFASLNGGALRLAYPSQIQNRRTSLRSTKDIHFPCGICWTTHYIGDTCGMDRSIYDIDKIHGVDRSVHQVNQLPRMKELSAQRRMHW